MGGFTSAIAPFVSIGKSISPVVSIAGQAARYVQAKNNLSERNALEERQLADTKALSAENRALKFTQDERTRVKNLNNALARQQAKYASQGLSANDGGTVRVVLNSIIDDSEFMVEDRTKTDTLKQKADELALTQLRNRNLLEQASGARKGNLSLLTGIL